MFFHPSLTVSAPPVPFSFVFLPSCLFAFFHSPSLFTYLSHCFSASHFVLSLSLRSFSLILFQFLCLPSFSFTASMILSFSFTLQPFKLLTHPSFRPFTFSLATSIYWEQAGVKYICTSISALQ